MAEAEAVVTATKLLSREHRLSSVFGGALLGTEIYTFLEAAGKGTY